MLKKNTHIAPAALAAAALSILSACGGGGSDTPPAASTPPVVTPPATTNATLQGTAAVGAPIVGGTVTLKCSAAVTTTTVTTSANGGWEVTVPESALPCALQVTGGTVGGATNTLTLHSLAQAAGVTNITQLTDLLLAIGTGTDPSAWFAAVNSSGLSSATGSLTTAQSTFVQTLTAAGYTVPNGLNAFTTGFTPTSGNAYDDLLEALSAGLAAANLTHANLVGSAVSQGASVTVPTPAGSGTPPTNPPTNPPANPAGITTPPALSFEADSSDAAFMTATAGTHTVSIYNGPSSDKLGAATLVVEYDGTRLTHTLRLSATNEVLYSAAVLVDKSAELGGGLQLRWLDPTSRYPFAPAGGKDLHIWNYYNEGSAGSGSLRTVWLPNGHIYGTAPGGYMFRNAIISGTQVPAAFAALAGTWVGQSRLCRDESAPLRVTITAEGRITINAKGGAIAGFSGWACDPLEVINTWDGLDDYIEQHADGYKLHLDSSKGHGSQQGGGIRLTFDSMDQATRIPSVYSGFSGAHTNIDNDSQPALTRQP